MAANFRIVDLISKKRNGETLTNEEIEHFVHEVVSESVHSAQLGAMLMAIFCRGLSPEEIANLTRAMTFSGKVFKWPDAWKGKVVDKHSTGGVGDKISLVLAPALAACGLKVPMISGRSLGHTGGTLDKLESIPGYHVSLSHEDMLRILDEVGCCIVGQTTDIAPADKILYAIRDVTATIDCIGLITSSIVSKKAAESLDVLVLDVKVGKGAFLKTEKEARALASKMVQTSTDLGMKTVALLTDMNTPIGYMIGNALEVVEAIECLQGQGPRDVRDLVVQLGGHLVNKAGLATNLEDACRMLEGTLDDGTALAKFSAMMKHQGVTTELADKLCTKGEDVKKILTESRYRTHEILSQNSGYIHDIDAMKCATVSTRLGSGRTRADDKIDFNVGIQLCVQVDDKVEKGCVLLIVYQNEKSISAEDISTLEESIVIKNEKPLHVAAQSVLDVIYSDGQQ